MIQSFARPYARAIYESARDASHAREVLEELSSFNRARRDSDELRTLFANPGVDQDAKKRVAKAVGERLGISDLTMRVLDVLIQNRRINDLDGIVEALREIVNTQLGIETAEVVTAETLDESQQEELRRTLARRFGKSEVQLELETDPKLLGGFVAKLGSEIYDASVRGRLERLRETIS